MYLQIYLKTHEIDDFQKETRVSSFSADPNYPKRITFLVIKIGGIPINFSILSSHFQAHVMQTLFRRAPSYLSKFDQFHGQVHWLLLPSQYA